MGKQRKSWSTEQKLTIVLSSLSDRQSVSELSRQNGVNENQIYRWREQFEGDEQLRLLGLTETRLIQSDAGSDFTSHHFQNICDNIGSWVRCRVTQVGGMGILERLNRTFKHEFIFRHEVNTQARAIA